MPDYVAEAHPELKSAAALKDDWQLFAASGAKKANSYRARRTGPVPSSIAT